MLVFRGCMNNLARKIGKICHLLGVLGQSGSLLSWLRWMALDLDMDGYIPKSSLPLSGQQMDWMLGRAGVCFFCLFGRIFVVIMR